MGGAGTCGETSDPIAPADGGVITKIENIQIHDHGEVIDP
jgi:hypothetical protein